MCELVIAINKNTFRAASMTVITLLENIEYLWPACLVKSVTHVSLVRGFSIVLFRLRTYQPANENMSQVLSLSKYHLVLRMNTPFWTGCIVDLNAGRV